MAGAIRRKFKITLATCILMLFVMGYKYNSDLSVISHQKDNSQTTAETTRTAKSSVAADTAAATKLLQPTNRKKSLQLTSTTKPLQPTTTTGIQTAEDLKYGNITIEYVPIPDTCQVPVDKWLSGYNSTCWCSSDSTTCGSESPSVLNQRLQFSCAPRVTLIGIRKSGTTDMSGW